MHIRFFLIIVLLHAIYVITICGNLGNHGHHHSQQSHQHPHFHQKISNASIAAHGVGCAFTFPYDTNPNVNFQMCVGTTLQEKKNGYIQITLIIPK